MTWKQKYAFLLYDLIDLMKTLQDIRCEVENYDGFELSDEYNRAYIDGLNRAIETVEFFTGIKDE